MPSRTLRLIRLCGKTPCFILFFAHICLLKCGYLFLGSLACWCEVFKPCRHIKETFSWKLVPVGEYNLMPGPLLLSHTHTLLLSLLMTLLVDLLIACNTAGFSWSTCDLPSCKCHPPVESCPKLGCFYCCLTSLTWRVRAEPSQLPWNKLLKPFPSKASVNSWRSWLFTLQDRYAIKLWQKGLPDH